MAPSRASQRTQLRPGSAGRSRLEKLRIGGDEADGLLRDAGFGDVVLADRGEQIQPDAHRAETVPFLEDDQADEILGDPGHLRPAGRA